MCNLTTDAQNTQAKRMEDRIADLDAAHDIETKRLGAVLAAAQSKSLTPMAKRGE